MSDIAECPVRPGFSFSKEGRLHLEKLSESMKNFWSENMRMMEVAEKLCLSSALSYAKEIPGAPRHEIEIHLDKMWADIAELSNSGLKRCHKETPFALWLCHIDALRLEAGPVRPQYLFVPAP